MAASLPRLQDATERRAVQDGKREALVAELRKARIGGSHVAGGMVGPGLKARNDIKWHQDYIGIH